MRFALAIFKYFPYGGIQRDLLKVARECRTRGHEVCVFTLRWEAEPTDEFEVRVVPIVGLNRHTQYEHFAEALNEAVRAEHFDLVVGFNKMPGLDVYYAGDTCYLEKALTQRDPWYRLLPRFKSFHAAEKAVFDKDVKTEILTISQVEVPRFRHHYRTQPERFHPLPPGIEPDRVAPPDKHEIGAALRAELGIDDETFMLLFVGSGFKKKGLDRALQAVAALPEPMRERTRFFVIGRDHVERFERMAMRLGITRNTVFFAEGRDDVPRFMFAADALIHPAYDETAGMVILEAMLAGLPVLVTKNCGYANFVQQHDAGLVLPTPFSQEALNTALVDVLTSEKRAIWSANGVAASRQSELFGLVDEVVDHLEAFAAAKKPLLVFALFRYFPYGGLQRDFMRIALACQAAGYDIYVYCLDWQGPVPAGFHVRHVEVPAVANHARYQQFAATLTATVRWLRPAAVIGFNKLPGLDFYYAADPCFEKKAREERSHLYRRTARYRTMAGQENEVFEVGRETRIFTITDAQREDYQRYYGTEASRFHLLPPGVSRDRMRQCDWQDSRRAVRAEFGIDDQQLLLLMLGSNYDTKGLHRAVAALAALPGPLLDSVHLLVVGQGHAQPYLREARRLGVHERLTICRGRDDVPAVLQGADLLVHPAVVEAGGLVLIEAIIAGLPVIASGVCGFAPYIERADAGRVLSEPFAEEELVSELVAALENSQQRETWSQNGVAFGAAHPELYSMAEEAVKYLTDHLPVRVS